MKNEAAHLSEATAMPDAQGRADLRQLPIRRVGVTSLRYR